MIKDGQGTLKYADGRIYQGTFKGGMVEQNGFGKITYPSGKEYEGH